MTLSPLAFAAGPGLEPLPPARAFGCVPADLDLDFSRTNRPFLVTEVVARCCVENAAGYETLENAAWNLPLGARILRLLRIVQLTTKEVVLAITLPCPLPDCRQPFELALPFSQLAARASSESASDTIVQFPRADGSPVPLRLPTGRDQLTWQTRSYATRDEALTAIVRTLIASPSALDLAAEEIGPLASAMEDADPLVAFHVSTTCPHCGHHAELPLDLETCAVRRLEQHQRALMRDIHELATRYGWSEAAVLAIPARRRALYRQMILAEEPKQG